MARRWAVPLLIRAALIAVTFAGLALLAVDAPEPVASGAPFYDLDGRVIVPCLDAYAARVGYVTDAGALREYGRVAWWLTFMEHHAAATSPMRERLAAMSDAERSAYYDERRAVCYRRAGRVTRWHSSPRPSATVILRHSDRVL